MKKQFREFLKLSYEIEYRRPPRPYSDYRMSLPVKDERWPAAGIEAGERTSVAVSVIVPVTNRSDDLAGLYRAYVRILNPTGRSFEFLFVVEAMQMSGEPIRVFTLPRSFGESTALAVGFEHARGDVIVTLAGFFQTVPEGVLKVLDRLEEGYDLVVTQRCPRMDSLVSRFENYVFHLLTRWLTGVQLHDISCGLKGMRPRVAREIVLYGDLYRFFPIMAHQKGFRVIEIAVPQDCRDERSRFRWPGVYLRRLLDIVTVFFLFKFTQKPLRFFGVIGAGLFGAGLSISAVLSVQRLLGWTGLTDRPLLILGVLLLVLGFQIVSIGLLGELIVFTHARKMKVYSVEQILK
jgi:glycosyltransferase involved in cell wall biosynthesis